MTRFASLLVLALPLQACIFYTSEGWDDDWDQTFDEDSEWVEDTAVDANPLGLFLDPAFLDQGGMNILSLQSSAGADLSTVQTVEFHGDIAVHALQAREREVVLSLGAGQELGWVDATIHFDSGESYWLTQALEIIGAEGDTGDPCED
ncbi:MAG: hypothetical protein KC912_02695 [Proteobacteria bacterium]|nr:hypothetical protein [Pseudomonadota bacterium]